MTSTTPSIDTSKASEALDKVTSNLKIASLGIRALYVKKLPANPQFKNVIANTTTNALILKEKFIPLSQKVLEKVKDFMENYNLSPKEFHECLPDISKDSYALAKQVDYIADIHEALSKELQKMDNDIQELLNAYESEKQELEKKIKEQEGKSSIFKTITGFLQFIPTVGPLVSEIAEPLIDELTGEKSTKKEHDVALSEREIEFAVISSLKDTVVQLFRESSDAFKSVTALLESINHAIVQVNKANDEKVTESHVKNTKDDAAKFIQKINKYIVSVPTITSNLNAIDKNFANEVKDDANDFMEKNESGINFLEVGMKVFTDPKMLQTITSVIAMI